MTKTKHITYTVLASTETTTLVHSNLVFKSNLDNKFFDFFSNLLNIFLKHAPFTNKNMAREIDFLHLYYIKKKSLK